MSVAQPHSVPTGVGGPSKPEDRPARCCRNLDMLAKTNHQRLERVSRHRAKNLPQLK